MKYLTRGYSDMVLLLKSWSIRFGIFMAAWAALLVGAMVVGLMVKMTKIIWEGYSAWLF